jgi:hypothetical protein
MMHLTASYLRAHGFCHEGCARFARRYPNGVELTPEWLREHADLLHLPRILILAPTNVPEWRTFGEAWRRYAEAWRACDEASHVYHKASLVYDKAHHAYSEASQAYNEVHRAYQEASRVYHKASRAFIEAGEARGEARRAYKEPCRAALAIPGFWDWLASAQLVKGRGSR